MRVKTLLSTILATILGTASVAVSQEREERFNRTVEAGEHGELSLSNISGDIHVEGVGGTSIVIDAVKHLEGGSDRELLKTVDIDVSQMGDRVRVETRHVSGGRGHHHGEGGVSVSYQIKVPKGTAVDLNSVSGNITLVGVSGEARVQSVSGDISASDIQNLVEIKSVSGEVEVRKARSPRNAEIGSVSGNVVVTDLDADDLNVSAVSGDVRLDGISSKSAKLESVSGDIGYTGRIAKGGRYDFQSHSGDVVVTIGDEPGFELEASTFSGDIESEFTMKVTSRVSKGRELEAVVGDGSAVIRAKTFSGDVSIRRKK